MYIRWSEWVKSKVDGPGELNWTVQTTESGRSWAKVGGSKEKTERSKGRKLDVMKDKSERSKKKKTGRSKVRKLYGHQG